MTEQEWQASSDPQAMLRELTTDRANERIQRLGSNPVNFRVSDRKLRLFAVACCRQPAVWSRLVDDAPCKDADCQTCGGTGRVNRLRHAVEVAEQFADGLAWMVELENAYAAAAASWNVPPMEFENELAAKCAAPTVDTLTANSGLPRWFSVSGKLASAQAALLRDIFGNPYRPMSLDQRWLTSIVVGLAQTIYDERDFGLMPILTDALLDAGCTDEAVLEHCRGRELCHRCGGTKVYDDVAGEDLDGRGGYLCTVACEDCSQGYVRSRAPHVRGCHVVDTILGKS